ncbi:coiled-coil domain-containing protein 160 [Discoglossus pictus]
MEDEGKHWVETLFSPHFSAQDFFNLKFEPDQLISEKNAKERAKSVEQIYRAALVRSQEEEKLQRKEYLSKLIIQDSDSTKELEPVAGVQETCACGRRITSSVSSAGDNTDLGIWTGNDLNLLRHEMNKKQSEAAHLKLQLSACKLEISELNAKYKNAEKELEALKNAFVISKKENLCKYVQLDQMEKDSRKKDDGIQDLRKELYENYVKLRSANKHLINAQEEIQDLQLKNKDLEAELKTLKQQQELKNTAAIEKVKVKCNVEMKKLLREIDSVKEELSNEKALHARDKMALELLRKHFSSLSMSSSTDLVQMNILPHQPARENLL